MGRKNASPLPSLLRALLSLSVILCLTIAPLCAMRCGARACTPDSSDGAADACHHSSSPTGALEFSAATTGNPCATGEIVFTAPRLEGLSRAEKLSAAPACISPYALKFSAFRGAIGANDSKPDFEAFSAGAVLAFSPAIPLRI